MGQLVHQTADKLPLSTGRNKPFPCLQAWAPVGMHKYHSFIEYVQLYPEYDFIMLGDNGQGDAMCADRVIMKAGKLGGGVREAMPVSWAL